MKNFLLSSVLLLLTVPLFADEPDTTATLTLDQLSAMIAYQAYIDSIAATINYTTESVTIGDDLATLNVPAGFRYIDGKDANKVLIEMWGNLPDQVESLGMLFPVDYNPNEDKPDGYAINITYIEDGYIEDEDAENIDYYDLMKDMKSDTEKESEARIAAGYDSVELVGWASTPFYDQTNKKLHWAKEVKFAGADENTLNYNILALSRQGYVKLNVIGGMNSLESIKEEIETILPSVVLNEGNRYADFNASTDNIAAYGIGGLIAGKILAKTGFFAVILAFLAKAWKIILVAFLALGGMFKKMFGGSQA